MTRAYLGLGGNVGNTRALFAEAIRLLTAGGAPIIARSRDYSTPPWGRTDQPPFINAAIEVETALTARQLLDLGLGTERALGRQRLEKWGPRSIDIDILLYGDERHDEPDLKIPHPFMLERAFVLVPLADIVPDRLIAGRSVSAHAEAIDRSGIVVIDAGG